jgi:small-conductance mechanosensitive channel/CRP-like cAMP-binding protein
MHVNHLLRYRRTSMDRLHFVEIPGYWTGFIVSFATIVSVLFLRRLLPVGKQSSGRAPLYLLALSLVLRTVAVATEAAEASVPTNALKFFAAICTGFAMTGVGRLLLFDVLLGRLIRIPATLLDLLQAGAFAAIFFGMMRARGVNLLSLITTSAVLTAVIGLALQNTIANLFAGLSLQTDRTINIGDWVQLHGRVARVAQIKWRSTLIVTRDGHNVIIPNGELLRGEVTNLSKPSNRQRIWLKVGFHYRHPPNEVKQALLDSVRGVTGVLPSPAPEVVVTDLGESSVVYALLYWINDVEREPQIEGEVRTRIWYAAHRAGLEIPYPIRTVHMTEMTEEKLTRDQEREFLERVAAIAKVDLFEALEGKDREVLARGMQKVIFAGGEHIIRQGDPGDSLYLIQDGKVAVRLAVEGVEREVAMLGRGQFFGEMSLMTGEPRKATCAAMSDVACYVVGHSAMRRAFQENPQLVERISAVLGSRQSALEGEREGLSAEASSRRSTDAKLRVLSRIRDFFHLG